VSRWNPSPRTRRKFWCSSTLVVGANVPFFLGAAGMLLLVYRRPDDEWLVFNVQFTILLLVALAIAAAMCAWTLRRRWLEAHTEEALEESRKASLLQENPLFNREFTSRNPSWLSGVAPEEAPRYENLEGSQESLIIRSTTQPTIHFSTGSRVMDDGVEDFAQNHPGGAEQARRVFHPRYFDEASVFRDGTSHVRNASANSTLGSDSEVFSATSLTQGLNANNWRSLAEPTRWPGGIDPTVAKGVQHALTLIGGAPLRFTPAERRVIESVHSATQRRPADYDVFLSYAHRDGKPMANRLVNSLRNTFQVSVWFDATDVGAGELLGDKIDEGLRKARVGVILVTRGYLESRSWLNQERSAMLDRMKIVIPVLSGVTVEVLKEFSPLLAARAALEFTDDDVSGVTAKIAVAVKKRDDAVGLHWPTTGA
jgi:TIR domain